MASQSNAQPIITAAYNPSYGDTFVYKIVLDTSSMVPGQAGAGVTWNLASMHGELTTWQQNWKQTALTNDAGIFGTNSNMAGEIVYPGQGISYEFYNVGANGLEDLKFVGSHINNAITNFTSGYKVLDYPFSFGQSCTDTMIGSNAVAYVNGRITSVYDGHGVLQLEAQSGGNFNNVARVKTTEHYIVNYGPIETHDVITYAWYDNTHANTRKQPIAIIRLHDWIDSFGTPYHEKSAGIRQILFINEVPKLNLNAADVKLYPNPFGDKISLSLPSINSEVKIEIADITGRIIKVILLEKSVAGREESIWLHDLNQGIYLAKISSANGTVVKKIIKE